MVSKLNLQKSDLESQVRDLEDRISQSESNAGDLGAKKKKLESEINELQQNIQDIQTKLHKSEAENKSKESQIRKMQDEMASQDDSNSKLTREKKRLEELNSRTLEQLQQEEDKVNHLNKAYTVEVDFSTNAKNFQHQSGTYVVDLIVSDSLFENPTVIKLSEINLKFASQTIENTKSNLFAAKPEIKHLFRVPEVRPPYTVSLIFTLLCLLPLALIVVLVMKF